MSSEQARAIIEGMFGLVSLLAPQTHLAALQPISIDGMLCHPSRLMVKLDDIGRTYELAQRGYRVIRSFDEIGWAVIETEPGNLLAVRSQLGKEAGVKRVDLDRAALTAYTPNDPKWPDMWHATKIKADLAWDISFGSNTVTVAIIDTGVNTAHEDLAANLWVNTDEIANNGIDDDSNGYIDDRNGYDFPYNDPIPNDVNGHGTACAGLAAGVQDNNKGITGVAPKAKIMSLKASTDAGYFYDSNNVAAYLYAADNGAKVISCSFFSDRVSQSERDAIDNIWGRGVLPVVAAGNDNAVLPFYPGAYENVMSVAATTETDARAGFSNYGSWVDVACPGVNLRSTSAGGGYTDGFGGTSGATPQVAGLASLIMGMNASLTNQEVRNAIEDSAIVLSTDFSNYGRVDCQKALQVVNGTLAAPKKPSKVRYITPLVAEVGSGQYMTARMYGRGLGAPHAVKIVNAGRYLPIYTQTRDYVDFGLPNGWSSIAVLVDGSKVAGIARPKTGNTTFTLTEGSTKGASLTGGFTETSAQDSTYMQVGRQASGLIRMEGTLRRLPSTSNTMVFRFARLYTGTIAGTETVQVYDWSSGSYPYGNWVTLKTTNPIPRTNTVLFINVPDASRFVDPEGTMLFRVDCNGTTSNGKLLIDMLNVRPM